MRRYPTRSTNISITSTCNRRGIFFSRSTMNETSPSGDVGFQALASWYGWAKEPIVQADHSRIENLPDELPLVFIYGSRTHIDNSAAHQILHQRGQTHTSIKVRSIRSSFRFGHRPFFSLDHRQRRAFLLHGENQSVPRNDERDFRRCLDLPSSLHCSTSGSTSFVVIRFDFVTFFRFRSFRRRPSWPLLQMRPQRPTRSIR